MSLKKHTVALALFLSSIGTISLKAYSQENKKESDTTTPVTQEFSQTATDPLDQFSADLDLEDRVYTKEMSLKKAELDKLQILSKQLILDYSLAQGQAIEEGYLKVTDAWISAVDNLFGLFLDFKLESNLILPNDTPLESPPAIKSTENSQSQQFKAKMKQKTLLTARTKALDSLKVQNFKLMQDLGILRTKLLRMCESTGCNPYRLNEKNIGVFEREIRIVPLKFVAAGLSKWLEIKSKLLNGFDGWIDLIRQLFFLFLLFLVPFLLAKIFKWISKRLDEIKNELLSKALFDYSTQKTGLTFWIAHLNPFIPSAGMILSIYSARLLIANTDFQELSIFLFYFQFFFVYRFVRQLLMVVLEFIFTVNSSRNLVTERDRIAKSATRIARLIFIEYFLLYIIEDTVRKALAYHLFSSLIFWVNIAFVFVETNNWSVEIHNSFISRYPRIWAKFHSTLEAKFLGILFLPLLFASIILNDLLRIAYIYLSRLDFVKRLLSDFLKNRLQSIEKEDTPVTSPPPEYLDLFDYFQIADEKTYYKRNESVPNTVSQILTEWIGKGAIQDPILIVGNRGMGKSTILNHLAHDYRKLTTVKHLKVSPKILNQIDFYNWMSELFSSPIQSTEDFQKFDHQQTEKTILFVDDIQNFFIGAIGGMEAYKEFLDILSLKTKNIFWCLSINSRSWIFLKGLLGEDHFIGNILNIRNWRDFEIKNLILSRHKLSGLQLRFDTSVEAYGVGGALGDKAEALFFRLLWGQSRGNPRSALMHWLSAVSYPTPNEIFVGVPSFVSSNLVTTLSDEALFLLSAITKHENLTPEELKTITNIDSRVIRKCLKEAEDKQLLWRDESNRFRISSRAQYLVDYFLLGKNFLYE
jgi:hypothetical protein